MQIPYQRIINYSRVSIYPTSNLRHQSKKIIIIKMKKNQRRISHRPLYSNLRLPLLLRLVRFNLNSRSSHNSHNNRGCSKKSSHSLSFSRLNWIWRDRILNNLNKGRGILRIKMQIIYSWHYFPPSICNNNNSNNRLISYFLRIKINFWIF